MKKGDIIQREIEISSGAVLISGCVDEENVRTWVAQHSLKRYGLVPVYYTAPDPHNPGCFCGINRDSFLKVEEAMVMWIVEDTVSLGFKGDVYETINIREHPEWKVVVESTPSYSSKVEGMSDEALKEAIDSLRFQRECFKAPVSKRKSRPISEPVDKSPVAQAINKLSKDKMAEVIRKLGL